MMLIQGSHLPVIRFLRCPSAQRVCWPSSQALQPRNSLKVVSWSKCRTHIILFLFFIYLYPLLSDIQHLENHCVIYLVCFLCFRLERNIVFLPLFHAEVKILFSYISHLSKNKSRIRVPLFPL